MGCSLRILAYTTSFYSNILNMTTTTASLPFLINFSPEKILALPFLLFLRSVVCTKKFSLFQKKDFLTYTRHRPHSRLSSNNFSSHVTTTYFCTNELVCITLSNVMAPSLATSLEFFIHLLLRLKHVVSLS